MFTVGVGYDIDHLIFHKENKYDRSKVWTGKNIAPQVSIR